MYNFTKNVCQKLRKLITLRYICVKQDTKHQEAVRIKLYNYIILHKDVIKCNTLKALKVDDEDIFEKIYENMSSGNLNEFLEDLKTEDILTIQDKNDFKNPENATLFLNSNFIFVLTNKSIEIWSREISIMPENIEEESTNCKTTWVLIQMGKTEFYTRAIRAFIVDVSSISEDHLEETKKDIKRFYKENEEKLNFDNLLNLSDVNDFEKQDDMGIFADEKKTMNHYMIALDSPLSYKEVVKRLNSVGLTGGTVMQDCYLDEIDNGQVIKEIFDCTGGKYLN